MSAFWKHYASVTDDVRHKLVEEGWYGRQVTGNTTEQDMPGIAPAADPVGGAQPPADTRSSLYEQTWGKAPTHADVYGAAPATAGTPTPTAPEPDKGHAPEL